VEFLSHGTSKPQGGSLPLGTLLPLSLIRGDIKDVTPIHNMTFSFSHTFL